MQNNTLSTELVPKPAIKVFIGIFLVSLATLMYEILLARIFSVTMWYHFAFLAISIAMFGMTIGGMLIYLLPSLQKKSHTYYHLTLSSLAFALTILFCLRFQIIFSFKSGFSLASLVTLCAIYIISSVPFIFSGISICLALTRFPNQVSKLYAADLFGAALGCVLVIAVLMMMDAYTAVVFTAIIANLAAWFFCNKKDLGRLKPAIVITGTVLLLLIILSLIIQYQRSFDQNGNNNKVMYDKWNSFSYIKVTGDPNAFSEPFVWGLSPTFPTNLTFKTLKLAIDSVAVTPLMYYQGKAADVSYLKYDLTNLIHYLRPEANVLVIGVGGGRDIVSSLIFHQKSVKGVEVNGDTLQVLTKAFGAYTGHLDQNPQVQLVNDEARSYIARNRDRFEIIQLSLIDTWAATAAGAYTLTENSLYTTEAWKLFLNHLSPQGVLSVSRWYSTEKPGEIYRAVSLAVQALQQIGVHDAAKHIIIVTTPNLKNKFHEGLATILVSRNPFTAQDLALLSKITTRLKFNILFSSDFAATEEIRKLINPQTTKQFIDNYPLDITAPTDNQPFFFQMFKLNSFNLHSNNKTALLLPGLLILVMSLTVGCIVIPLLFSNKKTTLLPAKAFLSYFICIGFGFMLIEISQMQRFNLFLGHPVYSLAVVLFTLLLASSTGSFLTKYVSRNLSFAFLVIALILFGLITPLIINVFQAENTIFRVMVAVIMLFPLGIFMGMPFPHVIKLAQVKVPEALPWFWGINGATSVCGSVLAMLIAVTAGISVVFWLGLVFYLLAIIVFLAIQRSEKFQGLPTLVKLRS